MVRARPGWNSPPLDHPTISASVLFAGYDGRADVWSIGVILYELMAFTRPFLGENIAQLAMAITRRQPKGMSWGT